MVAYNIGKPVSQQAPCNPHWVELVKDLCTVIDGTEYWQPSSYSIDGASIPRLVWAIPGIGSKTDPENLAGAFPHDGFFLTHCVPFNIANEAARQIWISAGKGNFAARVMYGAVASPVGKMAWKNGPDEMAELFRLRAIIRQRPDWEKFKSMWFADKYF